MKLFKIKGNSILLFVFAVVLPFFILAKNQDSLKVEKLLTRSLKIVYSNPDSAYIYCKDALKISKVDLFLKSKSLNHLGIYYDVTSNNDSAIFCYERAIELALLAKSQLLEASALNNLGLIYWNKADYDDAIFHFNKSIVLFELLEKRGGIASTLNNIGLIYNETKKYEKAIEYFLLSKENYEKTEDKYGISATYTNLAIAHHFLGNLDSSFYYNKQSIPLKIAIEDNWGLATNYTNLATDFNANGQNDSAVYYAQKAELLYRKLNNKSSLATTLSGKGLFLLDLKRYAESNEALKEAESLAIETNANKTLKNIYAHFATLNFKQEHYKEAYHYLSKRLKIEEEIYTSDQEKAIAVIQTKYETAKKDKELAENKEQLLQHELLVKTKNLQLLLAIGIVVFLIILSALIVVFQVNKRKKQRVAFEIQEKIKEANFNKETAEDKLRISRDLHDNIGAHLTFLIASIDNLAFTEKEEKRKDKMTTISSFGKQTMKELRGAIWAIKNDGASINELLYRVADLKINVDIPILILNEIKVEHQLSSSQLINLYRIIQEAIQNTTKHAEATKLAVTFSTTADKITLKIHDNGKGFSDQQEFKSNGLVNMKSRCESIGATFDLKSSHLGTKITCTLVL